MVDVGGQDIMTADKVSLRMNALVTYRIADARKAVSSTDDVRQALYRETQLALRAVIGVRELDIFLSDKDVVAPHGHLQFREAVPGAKGQPHTILEGGGHFLQEDVGGAYAEVLVKFLEAARPPDRGR